MSPAVERTARCSCGRLTLTATGEPTKVSACHCQACRLRTGGPFGVAVFYPREATRTAGPATVWRRQGDSGRTLDFHFCPTCGATVFWYPEFRPGLVAVAHGSFGEDAPAGPSQAVHEEQRWGWVEVRLGAV